MLKALGHLTRLRTITSAVIRHGLGAYLNKPTQGGFQAAIGPTAERFRALLEELGPTFVKFGQLLATRSDIFPKAFTDALAQLQDSCLAMSAAEVDAIFLRQFQQTPQQLFAHFEWEPFASASIAQVHRAITKEGVEVAVKVQRTGARSLLTCDVAWLRLLARLVENMAQDMGVVTPIGMVETLTDALLGELDFVREAAMMTRFRQALIQHHSQETAPEVIAYCSAQEVLTMTMLHGLPIHAPVFKEQHEQLAKNLLHSYFRQLFVDGWFHADPHPGNVLVQANGQLGWIDFGCVGHLSAGMREQMLMLLIAIGVEDDHSMARLLYRMGNPSRPISMQQLRDGCAMLREKYPIHQMPLGALPIVAFWQDLCRLAVRFHLRLPSEYALAARCLMMLEGLVRQIAPQLNGIQVLKPLVLEYVSKQMHHREQQGLGLRHLVQAGGMLQDLPTLASQLMADIERGQFGVQIQGPAMERLTLGLHRLASMVWLGLMASAGLLASLLILGLSHPSSMAGYGAMGCGLLMFGGCSLRAMFLFKVQRSDPFTSWR